MESDIVIIRDDAGYRLLHGHLRLANLLRLAPAARIEVRGEGAVDVVKTPFGYHITDAGRQAPLRCD